MQHKREPHEYSQIVRTTAKRGLRRYNVAYDPDIFTEDMKLSASLLCGDIESDVSDLDIPSISHYNTIQLDESQQYADFNGIALKAIPLKTNILGMKYPAINSSTKYFISDSYDPDNEYIYNWYISIGDAVITDNKGKTVILEFSSEGIVNLCCDISNSIGGTRKHLLNIQVGSKPKKIMVIRTPTK